MIPSSSPPKKKLQINLKPPTKKNHSKSLFGVRFYIGISWPFPSTFFVFCLVPGGIRRFPPHGVWPSPRHPPTFLRVTKFAAGPWVGVELEPPKPVGETWRRKRDGRTVFSVKGWYVQPMPLRKGWGKGGVCIYCMFSWWKNVRSAEFFEGIWWVVKLWNWPDG